MIDINAILDAEEPEVSVSVSTEEPEVAANLDQLRWLVLRGKQGDTGKSAYELAVELGFVGTEAEWLASLKGGPGDPGTPGVSPAVTITAIEGGHRVTITDADGAHTFDVMDGVDGRSPAITVTAITGGHRVTITDETHPFGQSFDVMDGDPGDDYVLTPQDKAEIAGMVPVPTVPTEDISANTAARHTHENKAVLDGITVAKVQSWDGKGTYSKPSGGIPKTDLASDVQTSLGKADTALQSAPVTSVNGKTGQVGLDASDVGAVSTETYAADMEEVNSELGRKINAANLQAALDDDVSPARFVLVRNGNTLTTVDQFISIANLLVTTPRRVMFVIVASQSGGTVTSALELYPTAIDTNNRLLTLVGEYDGDRYTAELTAASLSSTMTGTLVVEPIVTESDIPDASTSAPVMDGTAAAGTSAAYARGDHVHPSDTSKLGVSDNAYRSASIPMGHLDATSTATVMTATVDGITELRNGVCMWLQNGVITSASGFTLNVNGLGAKPCYNSLAAATRATTVFNVNYTMLFVYNSTRVDGGCWDIVYGVDTNTTYTPVKLGFGYGTCTTAAATAAKTASISSYALTTGGIVSIKFDHDVPAGATLNITSKGAKAIHYRGAAITAGVIKAGDVATFIYSTYYHLISIDRWGEDISDLNSRLDAITVLDEEVF